MSAAPATLAARVRGLADGFWLVPGAVAAALGGLGVALVAVDRAYGERTFSFAFDGDASAARGVLETIAGSLVTVAGVTFSLTVVVLVLVSGQFTPRSVPAFLADRVNQVTAGSFIGIFAYCLLVLRTVRDDPAGEHEFVPEFAVTTAVGLAVVAIGLLLYFIHHLGVAIQASSIVNRIGSGTLAQIEALPDEPVTVGNEPIGTPGIVAGARPGYVSNIALDELAERLPAACEQVRLSVIPGDFVTGDDVLAEVWPAATAEGAAGPVHGAIAIGIERDLRQDVLYGVRQLAEIALKGLSPGINDPTTAVSAIGYLRAALEQLVQHPLPAEVRAERGTLTVAAPLRSFDDYVDGAFTEVGRFASGNARVAVALLDAIGSIAAVARRAGRPERLAVLVELAEAIAAPALEDARTERDRALVRKALEQATARLP